MLCIVFAGCSDDDDSSSSAADTGADTSAVADDDSDDADDNTDDVDADTNDNDAAADGDEAEADDIGTYGDPDGTELSIWVFVDLHAYYYGSMVEEWNEQNPDNTIYLTTITYPYDDMHNKALMSLSSGTGAPDMIDVEIGQYPNFVEGFDTWLFPLDDYVAPYQADVIPARLEVYMGSDGHYYGAPYHVGATIMYYNLEVLEEYGITQDDIDAVVTWDDYEALGRQYVEARGEDGKYWTSVDTQGVDCVWIAMAQYGDDWTGGFDDPANIELDSVKEMLTYQTNWLDEGIAQVSPGGHVDREEGFQNILDHNIVSFPKAAWYMSRFLDYMPEEEGKWYLAPCPVFEEGQDRSVGIGGTGTVVTQQSEAPELAAEFITWAKLSEEGNRAVWDQLGFDVVNTTLWTDDEFAHDDSNKFNSYFVNYPYDVLNEVADEIGKISVVEISPIINEILCNVTLNEILEDSRDIDDALADAQNDIDLEQ